MNIKLSRIVSMFVTLALLFVAMPIPQPLNAVSFTQTSSRGRHKAS